MQVVVYALYVEDRSVVLPRRHLLVRRLVETGREEGELGEEKLIEPINFKKFFLSNRIADCVCIALFYPKIFF